METEIIQKAGLSAPQAKTYLALIQNGALSPAKIATITGETRTNTYALLDKLEKLHLVKRLDTKTTAYEAANPSNLEILAEKRRQLMSKNEQELKANISNIVDIFYANNEMPGSRTLSGVEGIKEVYRDAIRIGQTVYLVRTLSDHPINEFIGKYRKELAKKHIETYAITPDSKSAHQPTTAERDEQLLYHRTIMPKDAYSSPVSIMIYGPKVALMSFGETQMSIIITSPTIAESMRQLFDMLKNYWSNYSAETKSI